MTQELDLLPEVKPEERFFGVAAMLALAVLLTTVGVLAGEARLGLLALPLLGVMVGARRALRRRRERVQFMEEGPDQELRPWDERDFGAGFANDFYSALPQVLLVGFFGWLTASHLWETAWSGATAWFGLLAASSTLVGLVMEGGARVALLARGQRMIGEIEERERLEAGNSGDALTGPGDAMEADIT